LNPGDAIRSKVLAVLTLKGIECRWYYAGDNAALVSSLLALPWNFGAAKVPQVAFQAEREAHSPNFQVTASRVSQALPQTGAW
jgi:pterin-4a-carbinolamine dehydratase